MWFLFSSTGSSLGSSGIDDSDSGVAASLDLFTVTLVVVVVALDAGDRNPRDLTDLGLICGLMPGPVEIMPLSLFVIKVDQRLLGLVCK